MGTGMPEIDPNACIGCGDCVEWCNVRAVGIVKDKVAIIDPQKYHYCTDCERVCPSGAIKCPFDIILVNSESDGR